VPIYRPGVRLQRLGDSALVVAAPAKINLSLLVGPLGPDGFHPLDSYVARIALCDEIELTHRADRQLALTCQGADCGDDEQNLALRAARLLRQRTGQAGGVGIRLRKRIPPGRGLGGGSSDAAAVLTGLRQLWSVTMPDEALAALAGELGADVPLFLAAPAARMQGRGERLSAVRARPFWVVLVLPEFGCSTGAVYRAFDELAVAAAEPLDPADLAQPVSSWRHRLVNQLAAAAELVQPRLGALRGRLARAVDVPVHLTGSGSGMFLLAEDLEEAKSLTASLPAELRALCVIAASSPW
jgi:4-diphosphocytidyl-2-C-methyl-D-erythritol kinase